MHVPKWLKWLSGILVCVAFIREALDAGPVSLDEILLELQQFEFDISRLEELVAMFREGAFTDKLVSWDSSLDLFTNLGRVLGGFFDMIWTLVKTVVLTTWDLIVQIFRLFGQIITLVCKVIGIDFDVDLTSDFTGGSRGRR